MLIKNIWSLLQTPVNSTVVSLSFVLTTGTVAAAVTTGFDGINNYGSPENCSYGNRGGASYVTNLNNQLNNNPPVGLPPFFSNVFLWLNEMAWESDLHQNGQVNQVEFFAFAGHGLSALSALSNNAAAHFSAKNNNSLPYHASSEEYLDSVNAKWDEVRFIYTKWASFYSCNWLSNLGSTSAQAKINNMFQGLRLMTGFASIMYLDSREAYTYGYELRNGSTVKNAWFDAAQQYQPQLAPSANSDGKVKARVNGYRYAETDTLFSQVSNAPTYNNAPNDFSSWTISIPTTGQVF